MALQPLTTRELTFGSSDPDLNEGFAWARARALEWVQTGRAGGLPSYWAGLTDRPLFYARDVAHQALGAHLLGLDRENRSMLRAFVASATPRRAYYPLWSLAFDGTPAAIDYESDDCFVREVPAVFELVETSLNQYLWTGDRAYLDDPAFSDYLTNSVTEFVALHDPSGRGIAGESGGKDIFAGTPSYNESPRGGGMTLAADGLASQWAALTAMARTVPDPRTRFWARTEADRLRQIFEDEWWDEEAGHYAAGFLGDTPITDFAYEPSWFPAVKGMITGERADRHLDYLTRELAATPPQNIEAFTYLPEAYASAGHDDTALQWLRFLIDSRADYPEVPYTVIGHLVSGLTGLRPLGRDSVETRSHFPDGRLELTGIPFGDRRLDLSHEGADASILTVRGGAAPVRWTAHLADRSIETVVAAGDTVRVG